MALKYLVTDMDGVLADTEPMAMHVMDDWGVAFVAHYKPDAKIEKDYIYKTFPGTSTDVIVDKLIEQYKLPVDQIKKDYGYTDNPKTTLGQHLADDVTKKTIEAFKGKLQLLPGVYEGYRELQNVFGKENVALMTTSRDDRMDVTLEHSVHPATGKVGQMAEIFPAGKRRYSGYEDTNKYIGGFPKTGWNPAEAIIVEDSLSGAKKAKEAGAGAVIGTVAAGFYTDKAKQAQALIDAGADIVVSDMRDMAKAAIWLKNDKQGPLPRFEGQVFLPPQPPALITAARVRHTQPK